MNILVLGGTYFLGRRLVEQLIDEGHKSTLLNRGTKEKVFPGLRTIKVDRHKPEKMRKALGGERFEIVVDISGYTKEDVATVFACLDQRKIKQYIFCSSAAVYSHPPHLWPMTEKHPKCFSRENGSYGYKKLMAEEFLLKQKGLNISIVRPTYIYGPFDYSRRLAYIFKRIKNRKPVLVVGGGKNILQLGYVDDVARFMISTIGKEEAFNEAFNVGGEELVTLEQLIQIAARILGEEARIEFNVKTNEETCSFPDFHYFVSLNKAKNILGFQTTSLQEGMEKTIFWWEKQTVVAHNGL